MSALKHLVLMSVAVSFSGLIWAGPVWAGEASHGGGCRKSSPPGQCCHMDRSTGVVHCH